MKDKIISTIRLLLIIQVIFVVRAQASESDTGVYSFHRPVTLGTIKIYQQLISPSKGSNCPMYPSCSAYGYQAFSKHNIALALFETSDRLHRCGHDLDNYHPIEVSNEIRYEDRLQSAKIDSTTDINADKIHMNEEKGSLEEKIRNFALLLHRNNRYVEAANEYERLLVYYPETDYMEEATRSIVDCLNEVGNYLEIVYFGHYLLDTRKENPIENEIKFYVGSAYYKLKNYRIAREYFTKLADDATFGDKSALLKGISFIKEWDFINAENTFKRVPSQSNYYDTSEAYNSGNDGFAAISTILSFGWYSGNIYGSVISANRKNEKIRNDFVARFVVDFKY